MKDEKDTGYFPALPVRAAADRLRREGQTRRGHRAGRFDRWLDGLVKRHTGVGGFIKAIAPPPPPDPVKVEAALSVKSKSAINASSLEKWTQFILIGQDFAFAVIAHNRLEADAAFAAEAELNSRLKDLNAQRLAALKSS